MRTQLAIIAVSAFAVSAVCLGGAFALGGNAIGNAVFDFGGFNLPRCDAPGTANATATTRSLPWDSDSDRAAVALPANTHYQAGVGDQLVVKGDPDIIAHVRVRNGVVGLDCHDGGWFGIGRSDRIDVTLPGKKTFRKFELLGSGDMQIAGLSQPDAKLLVAGSGTIQAQGNVQKLNMAVAGSGTIEANAKAENTKMNVSGSGTLAMEGLTGSLDVGISGSGQVKAENLAVKNADVHVSGSGRIKIAPQDSLNVNISGSGTVYLASEPKTLTSHFSGSGRIVHTDGSIDNRHSERHARAGDDAIRAAVIKVLENSDNPDSAEFRQAKAQLKARIRDRVVAEIASAPLGNDDRCSIVRGRPAVGIIAVEG